MAVIAITGVLVDASTPAGTVTQATTTRQDVEWPRAEDGTLRLTVIRQSRALANLTGGEIILGLRRHQADTAVALSRYGTITDAVNGAADIPIASIDTRAFVESESYVYDVHFVDATGKRWQLVPSSSFKIAPIVGEPDDVPTIVPSTPPLTGAAGDAYYLRGRALASGTPSTGDVIVWNGSEWEPSDVNAVQVQGRNVSGTAPTVGQALVWTGSAWAPGTVSGGSGDATSLQGTDVSDTAPQSGEVLTYDGSEWAPAAIPAADDHDAHTIQGETVAATTPNDWDVLLYSGGSWVPSALTQDMIGAAFAVSSFSTSPTSFEAGQSVATPAFSASYSAAPDVAPGSVALTDNYGTPSQDVTSTPTSFASTGTFTRSASGQSVTFTLTARKGALTRTSTRTLTWYQKAFWGVGAAGGNSEAFIEALGSSALASSRGRSFTVTAGSGQKIYYAYPAAWGAATFFVGGFEGGFALVSSTIAVTNAYGVTENYRLYESTNENLGTTTVTVS